MTTIVSSIYGGYDRPKRPLPQSVDCSFLLVTDDPRPAPGWESVVVPDDRHPRVAAKEAKLRPWAYAHDGPWIWLDGSFAIKSPTFVDEALAATETIGMWRHPDRDCVYDEAVFSSTLPKYAGEALLDQIVNYAHLGHPEHWGLWAAGLIVYGQRVDGLADVWSAEIDRWGVQDQVSLPPALRATGIAPSDLPYSLRSNPWLDLHHHRAAT